MGAPDPDTDEREWIEALARCADVLEAVVADHSRLAALDLDLRRRLLIAAGRISRPDKLSKRGLTRAFRRRERDELRRTDLERLERTGVRRPALRPLSTPGPTVARGRAAAPNPLWRTSATSTARSAVCKRSRASTSSTTRCAGRAPSSADERN